MSLSQITAQQRSQVIRAGSISYNFNIILQPDRFYGLAEITFYLEKNDLPQLPLDFSALNIEEVIINSVTLQSETT